MLTIENCPRLDVRSIKPQILAKPGCSSVHVELNTEAGLAGFDLRILRERIPFGQRALLGCPSCGKKRRHLYFHDGQLACRVCQHVGYPAWTWPDSSWRTRVGRPVSRAWRRRVKGK